MFCGSFLEFIWSSWQELVHESCKNLVYCSHFQMFLKTVVTPFFSLRTTVLEGDIIKCITQISKPCNMKENQLYYSPWSCSCDVICSWKQEAIVFSKFSCGEVVANALHHNVDIAKRKSTHCLSHIAMDTYMDLKMSTSYIISASIISIDRYYRNSTCSM